MAAPEAFGEHRVRKYVHVFICQYKIFSSVYIEWSSPPAPLSLKGNIQCSNALLLETKSWICVVHLLISPYFDRLTIWYDLGRFERYERRCYWAVDKWNQDTDEWFSRFRREGILFVILPFLKIADQLF